MDRLLVPHIGPTEPDKHTLTASDLVCLVDTKQPICLWSAEEAGTPKDPHTKAQDSHKEHAKSTHRGPQIKLRTFSLWDKCARTLQLVL